MYISNLTLCCTTSFEIVLANGNKLIDFRVSGDPQVKYEVIFNRCCPWCFHSSSSSICSSTAFICKLISKHMSGYLITCVWICSLLGIKGHPRDPNRAHNCIITSCVINEFEKDESKLDGSRASCATCTCSITHALTVS